MKKLKWLDRVVRDLTALAIAPLSELEAKERRRKIEERMKRLEQKRHY